MNITTQDAIRFLAHEAQACRDRDQHQALCLLLPAMLRVFELPSMDDFDAVAFRQELLIRLRKSNERVNQ